MSEISADKVKELREKSGAGILDCRKALTATNGDLQQAIEYLRKEGVVKAAKKSGRATLEGLISLGVSADKQKAALIEVNCETDFVARTDQFQEFIQSIAEQVVKGDPKSVEDLLGQSFAKSTVGQTLSELIGKIGENMVIRRFGMISSGSGEVLGAYLHAGAKIGVMTRLVGPKVDETLARDIAMHVAAMSPPYIRREDVPPSIIDREKDIARQAPELAGKPANLLDKILDGKLHRYYSEVCLMEQAFVKDPTGKKTVGGYLQEASPGAKVVEVVRFQVGEEVA